MRGILLDRDGVICHNRPDHVKSWAEFEFLPNARQSLTALSQLGLPIVVVTNQAAIGRGLVSAATVEDIHKRMVQAINEVGGRIDGVYYCPSRPEMNDPCRKPGPGMLVQAADEVGFDLDNSYMVGDALTDLQAGQQVGCQTILVLTGRGRDQLAKAIDGTAQPFIIAQDLMQATEAIVKQETYYTRLVNQPELLR